MAEEKIAQSSSSDSGSEEKNQEKPEQKPDSKKGRGKWLKKIPKEVLFSPGGIILIMFAAMIEIIDLIPLGGIDCFTYELILEIVFAVMLSMVAHVPFQGLILPFLIERLPFISDVVPSFLIRMFI